MGSRQRVTRLGDSRRAASTPGNITRNMIESDARRRGVADAGDVDLEGAPGYMRDLKPGQYTRSKETMPVDTKTACVLLVPLITLLIFLALKTNGIVAIVLLVTLASLYVAYTFARDVLSIKLLAEHEDMLNVSEPIREGSEGFFRTQYGTISRLSVLVFFVILGIYSFRQLTPDQEKAGISKATFATFTAFSFLLGAFMSGLAGFSGMWVSVRANVRVTVEARRAGMRPALWVALRAGGFAAMTVTGLTVLGVTFLFALCHVVLGIEPGSHMTPSDVPMMLVGYGFGASFVALFAQLGGGIYTKAADVGADLVGKIEQDIPEDDPRNPATIADLVGDNVGDCAARGADLFESIAAEIISAMILGATMAKKAKMSDSEMTGFMMFPLVVHVLDLVVSAIGLMSVARDAPTTTKTEDPLLVMQQGYKVSLGAAIVGFGVACYTMLSTAAAPGAWMYFYCCGLLGIGCAFFFAWIAQYYTDYAYRPVKQLAEASTTGHGTNVIAGVALGMESTALPTIVISIAIISAFWLGKMSGLEDQHGVPCGGLFGTAVATMGMLSTAAYVLAMDIFGPISDNAGGIAEMSSQPAQVREATDLLDAVGNTTKATTKGFAIGSAALASFLLFSAFMDEVSAFTSKPFDTVDIAIPEVFVGGLLGSMLVFLFSAWACKAVGRSAQEVVNEVRRQFREKPGIMTYQDKPDHGRCVSIVAASALREMVAPGALAVLMPMAVGVTFRMVGASTEQEQLGPKVVAGFLMFATVTGIMMALFLNTAGTA